MDMHPDYEDYWFDPTSQILFTQGNLPHRHQNNKYQFVTFRLNDSLPQTALIELSNARESFLKLNPQPWDVETANRYKRIFGTKLEYYLDNGYGRCILKDPTLRKIVANSILHFNDMRYHISSFVVMPNHVHILLLPFDDWNTERLIGSIKQYSSTNINKITGTKGSIWMKENFDRLVRSEDNFKYISAYILHNPDGLCKGCYTLYHRGTFVAE